MILSPSDWGSTTDYWLFGWVILLCPWFSAFISSWFGFRVAFCGFQSMRFHLTESSCQIQDTEKSLKSSRSISRALPLESKLIKSKFHSNQSYCNSQIDHHQKKKKKGHFTPLIKKRYFFFKWKKNILSNEIWWDSDAEWSGCLHDFKSVHPLKDIWSWSQRIQTCGLSVKEKKQNRKKWFNFFVDLDIYHIFLFSNVLTNPLSHINWCFNLLFKRLLNKSLSLLRV